MLADLAAFLDAVRCPLAVRSSSLLEDSQYQPFTGVYETFMLPNHDPDPRVRLERLLDAIQRVYASTFSRHAQGYLRATPYRLEEEKMAVILQKVVGAPHGARFYPDFSGRGPLVQLLPDAPAQVRGRRGRGGARTGPLGGRGREVPVLLPALPAAPAAVLVGEGHRQRTRSASSGRCELDPAASGDPERELRESRFDLEVAEADGTLFALGSTYSHENNAVYDGLSRPGVRLVSFAPVLKHGVFPLAEILEALLEHRPGAA